MQRDKAALEYAGTQPARACGRAARPRSSSAFSCPCGPTRPEIRCARASRRSSIPARSRARSPESWPRKRAIPDAAWLVLACDLPLLDQQTLGHLLRSRRRERQATAYRSSHDGLPEPLCAIYEPSSREAIRAYVASGTRLPAEVPDQRGCTCCSISPSPARSITSTPRWNTARRWSACSGRPPPQAAATGAARQINVQYYALLREQAGRGSESLVTTAGNAARALPGAAAAPSRSRSRRRCCASRSTPSSASGSSR